MTSNPNSDFKPDSKPSSPQNHEPNQQAAALIAAQVPFMQSWLADNTALLIKDATAWLYQQPMTRYISLDDIQKLMTNWVLAYPLSGVMRGDIKLVLQSIIYNPVNEDTPLSELIDDAQVDNLARYISRHDAQRAALIHALIGNDTFADLLTKTLYHAINDFMEGTLDKAGGVGKLMKMGRSSFERATNKSLDDKLQGYLHRNIKELSLRAEANANAHLSNDEVARLLLKGWSRIKTVPLSTAQEYLNNDDNNSIEHIEDHINQSFDRLRQSDYLKTLLKSASESWYHHHIDDTIGQLASALYIDDEALDALANQLTPLCRDAIASTVFADYTHQMLSNFYQQPKIQKLLDKS